MTFVGNKHLNSLAIDTKVDGILKFLPLEILILPIINNVRNGLFFHLAFILLRPILGFLVPIYLT